MFYPSPFVDCHLKPTTFPLLIVINTTKPTGCASVFANSNRRQLRMRHHPFAENWMPERQLAGGARMDIPRRAFLAGAPDPNQRQQLLLASDLVCLRGQDQRMPRENVRPFLRIGFVRLDLAKTPQGLDGNGGVTRFGMPEIIGHNCLRWSGVLERQTVRALPENGRLVCDDAMPV